MLRELVILNFLLSLSVIFFERKEPSSVWAWLLVLNFLPGTGYVLYLMFGLDLHKSRMFRMKEVDAEMKAAVRRQEEKILNRGMPSDIPERFEELVRYNLNVANAVLTDNNDVRIYTDGKAKFHALLKEIDDAKVYIHLQYYIIREDELWDEIRTALIRKACEGVDVRVLYDSMGCKSMPGYRWERLNQMGVATAEFFPALFGKLHLRANYRNHRKIAVIDGRVGFVGGFNIGREYIGKDEKFGHWRDTHLRLEGSSVTTLAIRFALDWNYASGENLFAKDSLFALPEYGWNGGEAVQIISSGPDLGGAEIRNNYLRLIHLAQKNIYIQTPYFIPDEPILTALKIAAASGVDVRVMVPCKPDHPFVYRATWSYLGELLEAGARCYLYQNGFLHAKGVMTDGNVCSAGTANMDIRSFRLNFEVNAVIYSGRVCRKMEEIFLEDLDFSKELTQEEFRSRGFAARAREQFCRLLSPLL